MLDTGIGREPRCRKVTVLKRPVAIEGPQEKYQVLQVQEKGHCREFQCLNGLQQHMCSTL